MLQNKRLIEFKNGDDSFEGFSESCDAADGGVGGAALKTLQQKHKFTSLAYFI